ncbi:MAG: DNA repair protein RadA [Candidatus Scalindua rubra]|uniref:DNA repair protein RadA n=1 Tax=Candidatus Scalindua rubra TaxID=1872076 RepID=A0A1E3XB14_9BACT|nr:MAG: DNA repair protein RadA [Candidatus Scalindua rubra]
MAKTSSVYVCQQCGWKTNRWMGKCAGCDEWDSLVEEKYESTGTHTLAKFDIENPTCILDIKPVNKLRIKTNIEEFDRILGGGLVAGSAVLIGGTPGIGKSTILLQVCQKFSEHGGLSLYVTGEESTAQIKLRADRLCVLSKKFFGCRNNLNVILEHIGKLNPKLVIIDSIQTMFKPDLESSPGTVSQVRQCANELIYMSKRTESSIFLIGHVTKQGIIAGPKVLEHLVDTVLYFEGEKFMSFRILRAVKNRFGPTNEIGIFEMCKNGLREVKNPSEIFLSGTQRLTSGSAIISCIEGTRALLVEVQALVTRSNFGIPERKVSGVDYNRVAMIIAVLEKRTGLLLGGHDVFVNVVGGVKVDEPAADLGIAIAIASSFKDKAIPSDMIVIGELGLGGEVRGVSQFDGRLKEAERLGFKNAIIPKDNTRDASRVKSLKMNEVSSLVEAIDKIC